LAKYFKNAGRSWERELKERGAGEKQPLSGAGWGAKNDLRTAKILREAKHTAAEASYSLKKKDLKNLARNAAMTGRIGIMELDYSGDEYIIMRRSDWEQYIIVESTEAINELCKSDRRKLPEAEEGTEPADADGTGIQSNK
jgi:hypothetical protein